MKLQYALGAALAACALSASANVLTFQGVTFTTTTIDANTLQLEIDAAGRTGDWTDAVTMDTVSLKDIGSFATASLSGPGGAWTFSGKELNASGCGGGMSSNNACFFSSPVALGDDMVFTFTFTGGTHDFGLPHLKLRFLDAAGNKEGSLLSMAIPVPEPETYAMMLAGLAAMGFMARRRQS